MINTTERKETMQSSAERAERRKFLVAALDQYGDDMALRVPELAIYLEISPRAVWQLIQDRENHPKDKRIPVERVTLPGRAKPIIRFRRSQIDKWWNNLKDVT
jgi:predicted DNA-binding transcriptional regulator AlpA